MDSTQQKIRAKEDKCLWDIISPVLVLIIASFVFLSSLAEPARMFWDESYHIPSAQKYLNGVFFQENHPPLGKLLIALGEFIYQGNPTNDHFLDTMNNGKVPEGFDFTGYRLIPAILACFTALIFYGILRELTGRAIWALLLSSLYVFDNAFVLHLRGAMLEGTQLFFLTSFIYIYLVFRRLRNPNVFLAFLAALALGFALNTKANSLALAPVTFLFIWRSRSSWSKIFQVTSLGLLGLVLATFLTWGPTIILSKTINPKLQKAGFFEASKELQTNLKSGSNLSFENFYLFIKDHITFSKKYNTGVSQLNLCKEGENGSYPLMWPLGARTIKYTWNKVSEQVQYLYLVPNPAVWLTALIGLIFSWAIILSKFFGIQRQDFRQMDLLVLCALIHAGYMTTVLQVERALYLYHYFIPQMLCFMMTAILFNNFRTLCLPCIGKISGKWQLIIRDFNLSPKVRTIGLILWLGIVFQTFLYYSPLTYFLPIDKGELAKRSLLKIWDLNCLACENLNPLARPIKQDRRNREKWSLEISGLKTKDISQEWGDPKMNATVEDLPLIVGGKKYEKGLGVHAKSKVMFNLAGKYDRFKTNVGLPDYLIDSGQASVVFQVVADNRTLFKSPTIRAGQTPISVDVEIKGVKTLLLLVEDSGDGNFEDHALWLDPEFITEIKSEVLNK